MPFPSITEQTGARSATGFARETTFGVPVAANTFLPMTANTMEEDPGWFTPHVMQGARDLQIYNLYGEAKYQGAITGPIFPSNAMAVMAASIGSDSAVGYGVAAATPTTATSNTLNGSTSAGTVTVILTSATGFAAGQQVAVDVGGLQEIRKIASVASNTLTLSDALNYAHASGVAAVTGAPTSTLNGGTSAGAGTITVTSGAGFATNNIIQIDVNSPSGTTSSEIRKITNIATNVLTLDQATTYAHLTGANVIIVNTPYMHTFSQANTLPSLTIEKNLGSFQSLQFAGCKVNKFDLKAPVGNTAVDLTVDMIGQSVATLGSPTAISITNELPYVFTEASLTIYGSARAEVSNTNIIIENGLKETYTYSGAGNFGPAFITPVTVHGTGTIDLVWSSLTDATYGDFNRLKNGTFGAFLFTLTHPSSGGTITVFHPQIALSKYANPLKMEDVIMTSLTYEATRLLTGSTQYTVQSNVVNSVYLPY
jgi:hypothetical protein